MSVSGLLVLVATPIGNLGDISTRAIETLKTASVIACEDTRHTRKLLNHIDVRDVPVIAVHEHNEAASALVIVDRIRSGEVVALVTDAGMPAISDPGERVVAAVAEAGLVVSVVPGASAETSALAISGFSTQRFCFEGFLSRKLSEREAHLSALRAEQRTMVFYEAPHRLAKTVAEMAAVFGMERRVVLVRELTKLHEEVWRGDLGGLLDRLDSEVKGECVLVVEGAEPSEDATDDEILRALQVARSCGLSKKEAIATVVDQLGVNKNRVYDLALEKSVE